jgi:hypothetical protein
LCSPAYKQKSLPVASEKKLGNLHGRRQNKPFVPRYGQLASALRQFIRFRREIPAEKKGHFGPKAEFPSVISRPGLDPADQISTLFGRVKEAAGQHQALVHNIVFHFNVVSTRMAAL